MAFLSFIKKVISRTDLGSVIRIFDNGYSAVRKYSNFLGTLILCEINLGWLQKVKNCHFNNFGVFETLIFWEFLTFFNVKHQKFEIQNCSNHFAFKVVKVCLYLGHCIFSGLCLNENDIFLFSHCAFCNFSGNANYTESRMWHDFSLKGMLDVG